MDWLKMNLLYKAKAAGTDDDCASYSLIRVWYILRLYKNPNELSLIRVNIHIKIEDLHIGLNIMIISSTKIKKIYNIWLKITTSEKRPRGIKA